MELYNYKLKNTQADISKDENKIENRNRRSIVLKEEVDKAIGLGIQRLKNVK